MKRHLLFYLAVVGIVFTACEAGVADNGASLTPKKIATVEEQSANITATITTLETTKSTLNTALASLKDNQPVTRGSDNGVKEMIAALEERIAALEEIISNLQNYTDEELSQSSDWLNTTFATLEQQEALAAELAELKALLAAISGVSTESISNAIAASEESMKTWINEQLTGYATIAEVEVQIAALKESITNEMREEIDAIVTTLTTLKSQIEEGYKSAIASAITEFAGVINKQIADEIAAVNKRIDDELGTINSRLDAIEKRLDEIEEALANLIKQIQSLEYIDSNGDEPTPVVTSTESTTVTLNFRVSPSKAAGELAANWREYVKVRAYYTDDINTIVDLPITSYTGNGETGMISIEASGENLSDRFYTDLQQASLYLKISDGNNDRESQSIAIKAQRWMREDINLVPNDNEIYYTTIDGNAAILTSTEGFGANFQTNLYDREKGIFVLGFDGEITAVGSNAFKTSSSNANTTLIQVKLLMLPNSIKSIGKEAFKGTKGITHFRLSDNLVSIGESAFDNCHGLIEITIPESVTEVGKDAFSYCSKLERFYGKFASKDNCCLIVDGVLRRTVAIFPQKEYTLPEEVKWFGDGCIYIKTSNFSLTIPDSVEGLDKGAKTVTESSSQISTLKGKFIVDNRSMVIDGVLCGVAGYKLTEYKVPENVTRISQMLFYNCDNLQEVWIPKTVNQIASRAFYDCNKLKHVYCKAIEPPKTSLSNGAVTIFQKSEAIENIFVPRESISQYQQSEYWKDFASKLVPYDF